MENIIKENIGEIININNISDKSIIFGVDIVEKIIYVYDHAKFVDFFNLSGSNQDFRICNNNQISGSLYPNKEEEPENN